MTWLVILKYALQLVAYIARQADRLETEKVVLNEVEQLHKKRVDTAVAARDDVLAGRVPVDPSDPNRRD
jgi:hypothetical protein